MNWEDRITLDPAVLVGKPVIRGTRLAVEFIVGLLANGWSIEDVLREYDDITREDVQACLACSHGPLTVTSVSADVRTGGGA